MKALATHKPVKPYKKPSAMLGFLLLAMTLVSVIFLSWQIFLEKGSLDKLKAEHLLAAVGVSAAILGGLFSGWISLHNSIRQHTITALLDSRLSETYMGYADRLSRHYSDYERRKKANPALRENPTDHVDILALRYILNYFEFVAIGVMRGDFDEGTLKDSLRSILRKNVSMSMAWIKIEQSSNPLLFTNLIWLFNRWAY
jgi:hypothetical protein